MPVETGDILRVAARLNNLSIGDVVNVYHYRRIGTQGTDTQAVIDGGVLMNALYTTINSRVTNLYNYADINVFNVTQSRPLGVIPWPVLTAGANASEPLPNQVAAFVRGTSGYSRNWARKFLGCFTETDNSSTGTIMAALMTPLAAFGAEWLTLNTSGLSAIYEPVVWHSQFGLWRLISAVVLNNVWATMRRRRRGVGS